MGAHIDELLARARQRRALPVPAVRRALRKQAGLTQDEIAQALGVTRPAVTRWESGQRRPRGQDLDRYLNLLHGLLSGKGGTA